MRQRQPVPAPKFSYLAFRGGLDEVTPPWEADPGTLREAQNYEMSLNGGYKDILGYERKDGRPAPSAATYAILNVTITGEFSVGDTITGQNNSYTAEVLAVVTSTTPNYLVITKTEGPFEAAESLEVSATAEGTAISPQLVGGASSPLLHAQYTNFAADNYRADILAVPGSGSVLGVATLNDIVYAFRNNAGDTAADMYKSTAAGWVQVPLGQELPFTQGNEPRIQDGDTIRGVTSNTSAVVGRVSLESGSWEGGDAAGRLILTSQTGTFIAEEIKLLGLVGGQTSGLYEINGYPAGLAYSGEEITPHPYSMEARPGNYVYFGGQVIFPQLIEGVARITGDSTAITLVKDGSYRFHNSNLGTEVRMYGCDGVNRGFEFDGAVFAPIASGMETDAPDHVIVHNNHLFYSFGNSVQHSALGEAFNWEPILGASEINAEDIVTGFALQPGDSGDSALLIFSENVAHILYGNTTLDWNLVEYREEIGGYENSVQVLDDTYFMGQRGLTSMKTSQKFGNFVSASISDRVRDSINVKKTQIVASCISRNKNQYRIFFDDKSSYYVTILNGKVIGIMPIIFDHQPVCVASDETLAGSETLLFGGDDGYVYEMEKGTSFDGNPIEAAMIFQFNHLGSPRLKKKWKSAALEISGDGYGQFYFAYDLGYGNASEMPQPSSTANLVDAEFAVSRWDEMVWDAFTWDGVTLEPSNLRLSGSAENISMIIRKNSDFMEPLEYSGAFIRYLPRRYLR